MRTVRAAVVGGGIIGVAVARQLVRTSDDIDVTVFEKEDRLAAHQTGHNSGVVHAGLYYPPGSLKATLCRRGVELLQDFARTRDLRYDECGKVVVARDVDELDRLRTIFERAVANGVPDLKMLDADALRAVEPYARGIAALHSPHTAVVDYVEVTDALAADLRAGRGRILLSQEVVGLAQRGKAVEVSTPECSESFDVVITCAGLQSDRLARRGGDPVDPRIVPFFGEYYLVKPHKRHLVQGLIYPVPDPRYPFLGIHLTKRVDGAVMVGPNAFLSMGRESYARRAFSLRDGSASVSFPGFWRFAGRNMRVALRESRTVLSTSAFIAEARKYVPDLGVDDVVRGPRGVRAQAMDSRGGLIDDFVITGIDRLLHVRNAPSPGATSSMAIAEYVVAEALQRADLT